MKLPDKFEVLIPIAIEMGTREGQISNGNIQRYLHVSYQLSCEIIDFLVTHNAIYKDKRETDPTIWKLEPLESYLLCEQIIHERTWQTLDAGNKKWSRIDAIDLYINSNPDYKSPIPPEDRKWTEEDEKVFQESAKRQGLPILEDFEPILDKPKEETMTLNINFFPQKNHMIEKKQVSAISFSNILEKYKKSKNKYKLPVFLGKDEKGKLKYADLIALENILMAGSTGSGKSVFNNALIWSLILSHSPEELRLYIADVKRVEFSIYNGIPYLLDNVHEDVDDVLRSLEKLSEDRTKREKLFKKSDVKTFEEYNNNYPNKKLPYIVIIIDTFSDMMMYDSSRFEKIMRELLTNSKKYGMYTVMCDSRPSVDVYTHNLRKLFPTRIAFNTASTIDSRVILGQQGAETLLGRGDMLFLPPGLEKPIRLQAPFLDDVEINKKISDYKN